jgi:hypothetical protein
MLRKRTIPLLAALALLLVSCGQTLTPSPPPTEGLEGNDPLATGEPEYTWSQLLGRDDILPIYKPEFVPVDQAGYSDTELVMGVELDGEAKAYPVGLLNRREMVNDQLKGIPILVTW